MIEWVMTDQSPVDYPSHWVSISSVYSCCGVTRIWGVRLNLQIFYRDCILLPSCTNIGIIVNLILLDPFSMPLIYIDRECWRRSIMLIQSHWLKFTAGDDKPSPIISIGSSLSNRAVLCPSSKVSILASHWTPFVWWYGFRKAHTIVRNSNSSAYRNLDF